MTLYEDLTTNKLWRFALVRDGKIVADGALFQDSSVAMRWRGERSSFQTYEHIGHLATIHHVGKGTEFHYLDGVCWACGEPVVGGDMIAWKGGQCRRCSSSWDGPPSLAPEPESGTWKHVGSIEAVDRVCHVCSGSGVIEQGPVDGRCQKCKGTGTLEAPDEQ